MISVIIPFYNVEPYISACVESVIRQTETDLEIILIDDGSRDRSGRICYELARKDSRLRVIHTPHRGVAWKKQGASGSPLLTGTISCITGCWNFCSFLQM